MVESLRIGQFRDTISSYFWEELSFIGRFQSGVINFLYHTATLLHTLVFSKLQVNQVCCYNLQHS